MRLLYSYRTVLKNFTYLSILNGLNILLPLLIMPYLTRTVGASNFGDYLFVLVLAQNINNITSYGYNFSATKKISQNRDNKAFVNKIYNAVIAGRFLIATILIGLIYLLSPIIFKNQAQLYLFITAIGMLLGDVFIPAFLFLGMERMKYITFANAFAKILFTVLVLLIITEEEDYLYILLINSLGYIIAAIISQVLVCKEFGIHLQKSSVNDIKTELREGLTLFSTTMSMTLYRNLNVLILNYFVSSAAVAVYGVAEKVIKACQSMVNPLSQALYPHLSYQFGQADIKSNILKLKKISLTIGAGLLCFVIVLFLCTPLIPLVFGDEFNEAVFITNMMLPVLFFGCMNYILGFAGLVNMNQQKFFLCAAVISGTLSLFVIIVGAGRLDIRAAAIAMNLSEICLFGLCISRLIRLYYGK